VKKKVVLEGEFTYGFMGSAGQWNFRLNGQELDPQITTALNDAGLVESDDDDEMYHPRKTAGKLKITIEQEAGE
jgi:hypothetical protein